MSRKRNAQGQLQPEEYGKAHRFYYVARAIVKRVNLPSYGCYKWYGRKGVGICKEWLEDPKELVMFLERLWFKQFSTDDYSLYGTGTHQYSIDRVDNDRGYYPDNLRFATKKEQRANSRRDS